MSTTEFIETVGYSFIEIVSPIRKRDLCTARHAVMFHLRRREMTVQSIGRLFNRNHSTVLHWIEQAKNLKDVKDPDMLYRLWLLQQIDPD